MSEFGKWILQASDTFYMDRTFSTVPAPAVRQLYTVIGDGGGPCLYTLLPNKK